MKNVNEILFINKNYIKQSVRYMDPLVSIILGPIVLQR